ncbi:MAG: hypothetical protein IMX04_02820 [Candidatus Carbobacillus altaicus]|nr:hypothetical protein [Candidatus Carbobacillus altaicus]
MDKISLLEHKQEVPSAQPFESFRRRLSAGWQQWQQAFRWYWAWKKNLIFISLTSGMFILMLMIGLWMFFISFATNQATATVASQITQWLFIVLIPLPFVLYTKARIEKVKNPFFHSLKQFIRSFTSLFIFSFFAILAVVFFWLEMINLAQYLSYLDFVFKYIVLMFIYILLQFVFFTLLMSIEEREKPLHVLNDALRLAFRHMLTILSYRGGTEGIKILLWYVLKVLTIQFYVFTGINLPDNENEVLLFLVLNTLILLFVAPLEGILFYMLFKKWHGEHQQLKEDDAISR